MVFSAMLYYTFADIFDHKRKTVAAYMRVGIGENGLGCAETHKLMQDLPDVAAL